MKRAVVFLDILGFKKMVDTITIEDLSKKYERMIDLALNMNVKQMGMEQKASSHDNFCKQFIFSDSIILIANDDSIDAFTDLIVYTWRIQQASIAQKMPLRGAVSYGDIYINEKKNIVLGKALTEAYSLEGKQEWIGVILDNAIETRYQEFFNKRKDGLFEEILYTYNVPLKQGRSQPFKAINWRVNFTSDVGTKALFENPDNDAGVERKISNTLLFAKHIRDRGNLYTSQEPFHNKMWVGGVPPPFKHGDEY